MSARRRAADRTSPPVAARVIERVTATARKHELFRPGQTVLVACSGGPDSTCLLHALHRLRRLLRVRLVAFHFDHRLRPDSGEDAAYVERQARRLEVPFVAREAADRPARGESLEAWARMARYGALTQAAADTGAEVAALGHTLDDQAETVLMALVRGGGLEALAGMAPASALPPLGLAGVRPLLETPRADTEAFCRALRLRPREDPMNRDPRFLRARIRADVLPLLEERLDRGVRATLARTAEHVRGDAEYLEAVASQAARRITRLGEDEVLIAAPDLAALPPAIGARVVRQALRLAAAAAGAWAEPGASHVHAVLDLAAGRPGRRAHLPGGLLAARHRGYVRVARASPEAAPSGPSPSTGHPSPRTGRPRGGR